MARSDRFDPWLALMALAVLGLTIRAALGPLVASAPAPEMAGYASQPLPVEMVRHAEAPAWPLGAPATVHERLSLSVIAG